MLSFSYNLVLFNELVVKECVQNGTGEIVTQVCPTDMRLDETYVKVYKVYMYAFFMAFAPFMLLLILNALIISKICQLTQLRKRNQLGQSSRYQTFFHPKNCIEVKTDAVHIVTSNTAILQEQTITVKATCANCTGKGSEKKGVLTVKVKSLFNRQNSYSNGTTSTLTTPISRRSCSRERNYRLSNSDKIDDFYESPLKKFSDGKSAKENLSDGPLMLVMVVALFLVCNSVALIVNIFEATISGEEASEAAREVLPVLIDVGSFLVVFNSSANFLIYIIFSKQFRKVLFRTIVCCWSRQLANDNKQLSTSCSHDENSLLIFENYDTIPTGVPRKVSQNDGTISKEEKSGCFSRDSSINNRGIIELISFADQESPENN